MPTPRRELPPPNRLERASEPLVEAITALPPAVPVLTVLALVVIGGLIPGWGWVLMTLAALFLLWVLVVGWRRLTHAERLMRIAVLVFLVAVTITKAAPR